MDTNLRCSFCVDKYCQALKNINVKLYHLIREFFPITVVLSGLTVFNVFPFLWVVKNLIPVSHLGTGAHRKVKNISKWQNYVHQVKSLTQMCLQCTPNPLTICFYGYNFLCKEKLEVARELQLNRKFLSKKALHWYTAYQGTHNQGDITKTMHPALSQAPHWTEV